MPKIRITDAKPGQRLTRPAVTRTGMVMVQAGAELTAPVIERLRNLGIDSVSVQGERKLGKPLDVILGELNARFQGHEQDPWMMELREIVDRHLRSLAAPDHA